MQGVARTTCKEEHTRTHRWSMGRLCVRARGCGGGARKVAPRSSGRALRRTPAPQPPLVQAVHEAVTGDSSATPHPPARQAVHRLSALRHTRLCLHPSAPAHKILLRLRDVSHTLSWLVSHSVCGQQLTTQKLGHIGEVSFGFVRRQQLTRTLASHFQRSKKVDFIFVLLV